MSFETKTSEDKRIDAELEVMVSLLIAEKSIICVDFVF